MVMVARASPDVRESGGDGEVMEASEGSLLSHPSLLLAER